MRRLCAVLPIVLVAGLSACSDSSSPTDPGRPSRPSIQPALLASCGEVTQAHSAELAYVQYCTRASECGQPLVGTSCGCTRDLVARLDADPGVYYGILERFQELDCNVPSFVTPCDCPPADGFACVANRCRWNYTGS